MPTTAGLHHVTAIAGDPQDNADFYVGTLGLRFVKRTVNHDDTGTYHFYFGDHEGTPGTNITFFPWGDRGRDGEFGAGQTSHTAYLVHPDSLKFWRDRLQAEGVDVSETERFGERVLQFADPDGIGLELVASESAADAETVAWADGPVPAEHQLRGFHSVTLAVAEFGPTTEILTDVLGYEHVGDEDGRRRFCAPGEGPHSRLDLVETDQPRGRMGIGTVHHVAFQAEYTDEEQQYREAYQAHGLQPGGVLFEIATNGPGFAEDEAVEDLGTSLVLPEWLENERERIEAELPAFDPPSDGAD
jgi:glyoxalase family protein